MKAMKNKLKQLILEQSEKLLEMADRIFDNPEYDGEEVFASGLLEDYLERNGFQVERGLGSWDTAFRAVWRNGEGGPRIGLLCEYDALRKLGHGCGHHMQGPAICGTAVALKNAGIQEPFELIVYGTPAEETRGAKITLWEDGYFRDIDVALMMHGGPDTCVDEKSMALSNYTVTFHGKGAHAALAPEQGRSALDAVELMDVGVNYMREHIEPTDRIHYAVLDTGGTSPNVVQSHAEVLYLIRSTDAAKVRALYDRVCKIARGAAMMTETEVQIVFDKGCSETLSNPVLEGVLYDSMKKIPLPAYTPEELAYAAAIHETCLAFDPASDLSLGFLPNRQKRHYAEIYRTKAMADLVVEHQHLDVFVPGSSDVGDASKVVPTAQFIAATATPGTPAHSWQMTAQGKSGTAAKGMWYAAQVLADAAITLVQNPALIQKAKQEFREATEGKPYECPIPANIPPHRNVEELLALQK